MISKWIRLEWFSDRVSVRLQTFYVWMCTVASRLSDCLVRSWLYSLTLLLPMTKELTKTISERRAGLIWAHDLRLITVGKSWEYEAGHTVYSRKSNKFRDSASCVVCVCVCLFVFLTLALQFMGWFQSHQKSGTSVFTHALQETPPQTHPELSLRWSKGDHVTVELYISGTPRNRCFLLVVYVPVFTCLLCYFCWAIWLTNLFCGALV